MVFFSKNRITAMMRLRNLQKRDRFYSRYSNVQLAKKQIKHIQGWKTWVFVS